MSAGVIGYVTGADLLSEEGLQGLNKGIIPSLLALGLENALCPGLELLLHLATVLISTTKRCQPLAAHSRQLTVNSSANLHIRLQHLRMMSPCQGTQCQAMMLTLVMIHITHT